MNVTHILRNGVEKSDIAGHIVKYENAKNIYDVMRKEYIHADHERIESSGSVR